MWRSCYISGNQSLLYLRNCCIQQRKLVRFYLPIKLKDPENKRTWDVIRTQSDKIGQKLTDILREIAKENKDLQGIIDRIDFNVTTHGQRDFTEGSGKTAGEFYLRSLLRQ